MQTCYNCGKQVSDETLICPECGALVRRYTAAPAAQSPAPAQAPAYAPEDRSAAEGAIRLSGVVKVWLVILCVVSAYMAFSNFCSVFLANNPQFFDAFSGADRDALTMMLSAQGVESIESFLSILQQLRPLLMFLGILFAVKFICHLWLLRSARRLAFYVSIGVSFVGMLAAFVFGGSVMSILLFLDPLVTWLGLRRIWPQMRK